MLPRPLPGTLGTGPLSRLSIHHLVRPPRWRLTPTIRPRSYGPLDLDVGSRRRFHVPSVLLPPMIFAGLVVALYTWKSLIMITLQNKIIYMPGFPPNSRLEKISDYEDQLFGIHWDEFRTRAADGTDLALAVTTIAAGSGRAEEPISHHVYILYLQGNAASLPPRLPDQSWILRRVSKEFSRKHPDCGKIRLTHVALSYRGYWTSRGRPSENGINQDTIAAVRWISQLHANTYGGDSQDGNTAKPVFFIWGQSIGSGFATNLAASGQIPSHLEPTALILETPFLSIRKMLEVIYPQKWLPYRYLHPFLCNFLDNWENLGRIASNRKEKGLPPPLIFILQAGKDEIVPESHPQELRRRCSELGLPVEKVVVRGALHNDAMDGRAYVADFIMRETARAINSGSAQ